MNSALKAWVRAMEMTAPIARHPTRTLPIVIDELADRFESSPALLSKETRLSYRDLAEASHRYARWAFAEGLRAGDVAGLLRYLRANASRPTSTTASNLGIRS